MSTAVPDQPAPRFSVITVCLNADATIEQTIRSVLDQDVPHLEYIIIDGGSTDSTLEIIDRHRARLARVVNEPDDGLYDAMNKGIRLATGDLVGLVNADDFLEPGALATVASARAAHPEADLYHGHVRMNDPASGARYVVRKRPDVRASRWREIPILHPATFVTRALYDRIGLYDTSFRIAADYEFALRAIARGARFHRIDAVISNMRQGGVSTRGYLRSFSEARRARLAHGCPRPFADAFFLRSVTLFFTVHRLGRARPFQALYARWKTSRNRVARD